MPNPFLDILKPQNSDTQGNNQDSPNPFSSILKATKDFGNNLKQDIQNTPVPNLKPIPATSSDNMDNLRVKSPKTALVLDTIGGLPKASVDVFKDILQGTARNFASAGLGIANATVGKIPAVGYTPEIQNNKGLGKILYGNKPVVDPAMRVVQASEEIKQSPFAKKYGLDKASMPLAFAGVVGGTALDMSMFGGGSAVKSTAEIPEQFFKYIAKEQSASKIESTLKNMGLDDVNAKNLSEQFAPTKTVQEVKDVLVNYGTKTNDNPFKNILMANNKSEIKPVINQEQSLNNIQISDKLYNFSIGGDEYEGKSIIKDGKVVGGIEVEDDEIKGIKILPKYRNQGIAKNVIENLLESNKKYYIRSIPSAKKFWQGLGVVFDEYNSDAGLYEGYLSKENFKNDTKTPVYIQPEKDVNKPVYQGEIDLTTKLLKDLEGRDSVNKSYIEQRIVSGDLNLKQTEKDMVRQVIADMPDKINVQEFADKMKAELLPLKVAKQEINPKTGKVFPKYDRYENITLPDELRGNVKNYKENIYQSPIKTSAGEIHFGGTEGNENYFGHTRIEDMAPDEKDIFNAKTLEEGLKKKRYTDRQTAIARRKELADLKLKIDDANKTRRVIEVQSDLYQKGNLEDSVKRSQDFSSPTRNEDTARNIQKLSQYSNHTAHFRMIREEIKKASEDGKTKLQFPTGETAMKIEGLGETANLWRKGENTQGFNYNFERDIGNKLEPQDLKVGLVINRGDNWIITDVLGDGKFKAVPKDYINKYKTIEQGIEQARKEGSRLETFDISGKVDTNNPIYKFYEKDLGKYLTSKYNAKLVTDNKGVKWYEVDIKPEHKGAVEAFKIGSFGKNEHSLSEIKQNLKEIFGRDLPVQAGGLTRSDALGELSNATIKLLTENGKLSDAIAKHEAWHFYERHIATQEDRTLINKMAEELKKAFPKKVEETRKAGYSESEIAEELMADEFARYYRTGKTFSEKLKIFFDKILQKLEMLFKGKGDILEYFKKIKRNATGKLNLNKKAKARFNLGDNRPLSDADRLIAEGKIRVISRDGRDVYQIKKGGEWTNVRDEDSAVRQIMNPKKFIKKIVESPEINKMSETRQGLDDQISYLEDELRYHPAKQLQRFMSEGVFQDRKNPDLARTPSERKRIIERNKKMVRVAENAFDNYGLSGEFDDEDYIRSAIDSYKMKKERLADLKKERRNIISEIAQKRKNILERMSINKKKETISESTKEVPIIDTQTGEGRSIELQAELALAKLDPILQVKVSSLPEIISSVPTSVNKKVNLFDYIRTPDRVLKKIGFGAEATKLKNSYDEYLKELPKNIDKITAWSKEVPKDMNESLFKFLDGEAIDLPPNVLKVANEIKSWLREWADRIGIKSEDRIQHYITHIFDNELINKEFDEDLAKIISDKIPGSVYDPFLLRRLGAKGYKQDTWKALDAYVKRATRKVHLDPVLEEIQSKAGGSLEYSNIEKSQWKYIERYISNVNMRPTEWDELIDNGIKNIVGYKFGQRPLTHLLKVLRQATFRGALGLNVSSALRNLSQGINTYATLGEKYTFIGYSKLFNSGSMKELTEEGVFNSGFVQDRTLSSTKRAMEKIDNGLFKMFDTVEKINRGSAYFGAKAKAIDDGATEIEARQYAKNIIRKTQFSFSSIDLPVAMQGDIAKTLLQFHTYNVKQIEFLTEMAKDKNFVGLLRYVLAGLLFVYTIGKAFGMKPEELVPTSSGMLGTPPSLKFPVEVTKSILNVPDKYGNIPSTKEKLSNIGKSAISLFPAGVQINKTYQGAKAIKEGGSYNSGNKLQFKQSQTPVKKAQALIFGKYASSEAQDYFNSKSTSYADQHKDIKEIYDKAHSLMKDGKKDEAQSLVNELSDSDYEIYKKIKHGETAKETLQGKKDIMPTYFEIQKTLKTNPDEAQKMVDNLTDEQYKYYQLVKKSEAKNQDAENGVKPTYSNGEAETKKGLISNVITYAKAIGTDPITAFNRIFTGQYIRRVDNGTIIVERMPLMASEKVKKERGYIPESRMKLDHTVPLELGGSNSEDNLKLITEEQWSSYTPIENYLGQKLRSKELTKKEVQDLITKFKNGQMTADEVRSY